MMAIWGKNAKKIVSLVLLVAGLGFIVFLVGRSWGQLVELLGSVDWPRFLLSIAIGISGTLASSMLFRMLLAKHGLHLSSGMTHRIFFYGQVAKYVPGKIWGIMYQVAAVDRQGASVGVTSANLDLMLISVLINLSMAAALIAFPENNLVAAGMLLLGLMMSLIASGSRLSGELLRRILPKSYVQGHVLSPLDWRALFIKILGYFIVVFGTSLLSYYLMMSAVFGFTLQESASYMAYLIIAWVIGLFAFLVPAGIGVREVVFISFGAAMMGGVPVELLASIALISRCWQIAQDLIVAAIILVLGASRSMVQQNDSTL